MTNWSATVLFRLYGIAMLCFAAGMTIAKGGLSLTPAKFLLVTVLVAVLLAIVFAMCWPVWAIVLFALRGVARFLGGSRLSEEMSETMSESELVKTFESSWGRVPTPELRHRFLPQREVEELCQLPRTAVASAILQNRRLTDVVAEAKKRAAAGPAQRRQALWRRWALVVLVGGLIGAGVFLRVSDEKVAEPPVWVSVKYRPTQVNVANGDFVNWVPEYQGNVREAWFDSKNDYMIINLSGTAYHYCGVSDYRWSLFTIAPTPSADGHYDTWIKGSLTLDCRQHQVPSYP